MKTSSPHVTTALITLLTTPWQIQSSVLWLLNIYCNGPREDTTLFLLPSATGPHNYNQHKVLKFPYKERVSHGTKEGKLPPLSFPSTPEIPARIIKEKSTYTLHVTRGLTPLHSCSTGTFLNFECFNHVTALELYPHQQTHGGFSALHLPLHKRSFLTFCQGATGTGDSLVAGVHLGRAQPWDTAPHQAEVGLLVS